MKIGAPTNDVIAEIGKIERRHNDVAEDVGYQQHSRAGERRGGEEEAVVGAKHTAHHVRAQPARRS